MRKTRWLPRGRRWRAAAGYAAGLIGGAVVWQIVGLHSASYVFVPLTTTLARLGQMISDGRLPGALAASFSVYAAGVTLAIVAGALGGLAFARHALRRQALEPYLTALYAVPMVALIPFLLALIGYGFWPKVIVVWLFAVFPVHFSTQRGAQSIPPVKMVAAQIATLNWMTSPAHLDQAAQLGTVVGDPEAVMKQALQQYFQMGFWTVNGPGMPASNVTNMIHAQIAVGNLTSASAPTFSQIVDPSVYADALKLVSG